MASASTLLTNAECKSLACDEYVKDSNCEKCLFLEVRLKEAVDELNSAQAILDLLMKDLIAETEVTRKQCDNVVNVVNGVNKKCDLRVKPLIQDLWSDIVAGRCTVNGTGDLTPNQPFDTNITSNTAVEPWKTVSKGIKYSSSRNHTQQFKIPVSTNRYEWPRFDDFCDEEPTVSRNTPMSIEKDEDNCKNMSKKKVVNQYEKKHKVLIIGDSHARGCAAEINEVLEETYEVLGIVCPGAGVNFISTYTVNEIQQLTDNDVVIVWGGSNDVAKNETNCGIDKIQRFVESTKHTNIILLEVPHRFDLIYESCVNKEVRKFNCRLRNLMEVYEHTMVIQVSMDRNAFTKHGQHMNMKGKEELANRIADVIKPMFKMSIKKPTNLKMKRNSTCNPTNSACVLEGSTIGSTIGTVDSNNPSKFLNVSTYGLEVPTLGDGEEEDGIIETTDGAVDGMNDPNNNQDTNIQTSEESLIGSTTGSVACKDGSTICEDLTEYRIASTYGLGTVIDEADEGSDPAVNLMKKINELEETLISDNVLSDPSKELKSNAQTEVAFNGECSDNQLNLITSISLIEEQNCTETFRRTSSRNRKPPASRTGDFLWELTA
jgi:lysophospholipase L1-like esterase